MREFIKEALIKLFEKENWESEIENFHKHSRIDIIWIMSDFVKEKKYIDEAIKIAEFFINDTDPTVESEINKELIEGKETNVILTVRGSLCWLLNSIVATLDASYYGQVITLLEILGNDPVVYVRQQATYPLSGLMLNIRAVTDKEGKEWNYTGQDKKRVLDLSFKMLQDNRKYPRMMESLFNVFDKRRFVTEEEAMSTLKSFLYVKDKEFYPEYVLHNIAPLVIFFAEFAVDHNPKFIKESFQELLSEVILTAPPYLKTTLVWHIWKTIEGDPTTYPRFKSYIPLFFKGEFQEESLSQYEFLIERVMPLSPSDAVEIFIWQIEYIRRGLPKVEHQQGGRLWFLNADKPIEILAKLNPKVLPDILYVLKELSLRHGYIGDVNKIFSSYKKAPDDVQREISGQIISLYKELQNKVGNLPDL